MLNVLLERLRTAASESLKKRLSCQGNYVTCKMLQNAV